MFCSWGCFGWGPWTATSPSTWARSAWIKKCIYYFLLRLSLGTCYRFYSISLLQRWNCSSNMCTANFRKSIIRVKEGTNRKIYLLKHVCMVTRTLYMSLGLSYSVWVKLLWVVLVGFGPFWLVLGFSRAPNIDLFLRIKYTCAMA